MDTRYYRVKFLIDISTGNAEVKKMYCFLKAFVLPADQGKAMPMESFKDQVLRVGQQASFAVQMKGKKGKITASVKSPSGEEIDCSAVELEEGKYCYVKENNNLWLGNWCLRNYTYDFRVFFFKV